MSERTHKPVWIRPLRAAGLVVLRAFPSQLREDVGQELLEAMEVRLIDRRASRGLISMLFLALRELLAVGAAAFEARRELARAVRLGAPGRIGIDWGRWARSLGSDVTDAFRGIRRTPVPALLVVILVGLGVGANTSIFSVVDGVLLKPLPFPRSDDLVHVWADRSWQGQPKALLADIQVKALADEVQSFDGLAALWMVSGRVLGGERPVHTDVARVSASFFDLLGVEAHLGRTFVEGEDEPGAPWVAILEHDYWMREFGGDPEVIGMTVVVGWPEMEIIGVLPPDFHFDIPRELGAHGDPDLWIPWWHSFSDDGRIGGGTLAVLGRLAEGTSLAQAQAEVRAVAEEEDRVHYAGRGFGLQVERLQDSWVKEVRPALLILASAVGLVLLIAIANAAMLLLARTQLRAREVGLRQALGATQFRVTRLLVAESLILTLIGGALGLGLAVFGTRGLLAIAPEGLPRVGDVSVDGRVAAFAVVISVLSGIAAVAAPVLRAGRADPGEGLRAGGGPTGTDPKATRFAQRTLVVAQVAFSVVLLVGAGLLIRTFQQIQAADLGFEDEGRLTFSVYLMEEYPDLTSHVQFYQTLRDRVGSLPGVRSVSGSSALPLSGSAPRVPASTFARTGDVAPERFFLTEGFSTLFATELESRDGDDWALVDLTAVHQDYFEASGITVLAGRTFSTEDGIDGAPTMVVDRALAERFWSVPSSVGNRLWVAGAWREIIGVVAHARLVGLRQDSQPQAYLPNTQVRSGRVSVVVHTDLDPERVVPDIRAQVASIDPLVPIADVRAMEGIVREATARDRFSMLLMSLFAMTATALVALGIFGVLSFTVGERRREIAIRLTLGSGELRVARRVVREGLALTGVGLTSGILGALVLARGLQSILYKVAPHDLVTLLGATALITFVALAACWIPVARAVSVDPAGTLRSD